MEIVIVDVARTQSYIFGSNRLQENIGASYLVDRASESWVLDIVGGMGSACNVAANGRIDPQQRLTGPAPTPGLEAEVLYAGGGNAVVLFQEPDKASQFVRKLSRQVLQQAPSLQVTFGRHIFQPSGHPIPDGDIHEAIGRAFKDLDKSKRSGPVSAPLLGLGVTLECQSTGLPAVDFCNAGPGDRYPASSEILSKTDAVDAAGERLREFFGNPAYRFPRDFDKLGRERHEQSYLAVVHLDGNDMGKRFRDVWRGSGQDYIARLRSLSDGVKAASQNALKQTLGHLWEQVKESGKDNTRLVRHPSPGLPWLQVSLSDPHTAPVRPLVYGGDDVTFVCDGRLGLALATDYLRRFEEETAKHPGIGEKVTACAGIAIVKTHYPFRRAYELAEALCQSAKRYRREHELEDASCLDWHLATSGLIGDLGDIREREYRSAQGGYLNQRPVAFAENPYHPVRSWSVVRATVDAFQGKEWAGRRNKVKALRDTLRAGPQAVEAFCTRYNYGHPLPVPAQASRVLTDYRRTGWYGDRCAYFDGLELSDWFIPLDSGGACATG